jgi:hypothetical protein
MPDTPVSYQVYIDDSGTKEYADSPTAYSNRGGKSRYFVFGGVLVQTEKAKALSSRIIDLKRMFFGTERIEIKANWLNFPEKRRAKYLNPFAMDEEFLDEFVELFYDAITTSTLTLFASVIDKIHMQETYKSLWYTPAAAYEILLQRIVQHITTPRSISVIIDDMNGATPKGNQYRKNLEAHHAKLLRFGSRLPPRIDFSPLRPNLRFFDSAYSQILQVSDTVAYNVYRQFVLHGEAWEEAKYGEDGKAFLPMYDQFERIAGKFYRAANGRLQGFGLVKLPMRKRITWGDDNKRV